MRLPESGKSGRDGEYRAVDREDLGAVFPFRAKSLQNSPQILSWLGRLYKYGLALANASFSGKREVRERWGLSCCQPRGFGGCFSVPREVTPKQPPNPLLDWSVLRVWSCPAPPVADMLLIMNIRDKYERCFQDHAFCEVRPGGSNSFRKKRILFFPGNESLQLR